MTVIILDGHLKSALTAIRSLGEAGVAVVCGSSKSWAMGSFSCFTQERFMYLDPCTNRKRFLEMVQTKAGDVKANTGEKPLILCFSDATQNALFDTYEEGTSDFRLVCASRASYEIARSKTKTYELARRLGVPTIRTYEPSHYSEVAYPAVVKYAQSVVWTEGGCVRGSAEFVFSKEELEAKVADITGKSGEAPVVQTFVKGGEYGVEMVCEKGEALATFVHKRIRSLSPRGGAAVVKETAQKNEQTNEMLEYANRLVRELLWTGPVMVEFKVDAKTEEVLLMEINGRFWGSLPLAVKAGVDFPLMVYKLACGQAQKMPVTFSAPAVRTRHFLGDVLWVWRVFFARDRLRSHLYPSRLHAWWDFKKEIFLSHSDTFSWSDTLPWLMEYFAILRR